MSEGTVICGRCGVANPAGDQFCGSCGAFLEWEGNPTEAGTEASLPEAPPIDRPAPPPSAPAPLPAGPSAPVEVQPTATDVACTACGTANPPSRTFCQRCGAVMGGSPRGAGDPSAIAGTRPSAPAESGGLPFWLPLVAGIGLLAGIAVVVVAVVLRPAELPPAATANPSVTFTPTLPPSPVASLGAGGSVASAVPASQSVQLTLAGATASSVVGDREMFDAGKAIDGDLQTCWQEGAADEKGQWIEVAFAPSRLDYVVIYSGYQLNHDAYLGNGRPENVLVSIDGGAPVAFILADSEQPQRLDVDDTPGATSVRIQIDSTFDAVATAYPGSPFDDLAISEIRAFGEAGA